MHGGLPKGMSTTSGSGILTRVLSSRPSTSGPFLPLTISVSFPLLYGGDNERISERDQNTNMQQNYTTPQRVGLKSLGGRHI